jgi:hypothetical protein
MEDTLKKALEELIKQGPLGILLVVFIVLYVKSLKRQDQLVDKTYEMGTSMIKGDTEVKAALAQVSKDLDVIREDVRSRD